MSFVIGLLIGAALGYGAAWARSNPAKFAARKEEVAALFKRKGG